MDDKKPVFCEFDFLEQFPSKHSEQRFNCDINYLEASKLIDNQSVGNNDVNELHFDF